MPMPTQHPRANATYRGRRHELVPGGHGLVQGDLAQPWLRPGVYVLQLGLLPLPLLRWEVGIMYGLDTAREVRVSGKGVRRRLAPPPWAGVAGKRGF